MNFIIKKGIDCSWCVELMKKTLMQHFAIKKIYVVREKLRIVSYKKINPKRIIILLKKRGYCLIRDKVYI